MLTIDETLISDDSGEALFEDLPAGRYKFKATAANHQEVIGRFWIKPGITVSEKVFLDYNLVTVEWSVTEITIEDRYEINLEATYETDVPAAVVVIEPMAINLPKMAPGEVYYGEFTATNHGLIRADNTVFNLPPDDQYFKYEWLADLPTSLAAHQQISIPYRVTALSALAPDGEDTGGGCVSYSRTVTLVSYDYDCANGSTSTGSQTITLYYRECNGSDGGSSSDDSGSGGKGGGDYYNLRGYPIGGSNSPGYSSLSGGGDGCRPNPGDGGCDGCCGPGGPGGGSSGGPGGSGGSPPPCTSFCPLGGGKSSAQGQDGQQSVGSLVDTLQTEFHDDTRDLFVKVPGGIIAVKRQFYENVWHWTPLESHLHFNWDASGNYIESIDKEGFIYQLSTNSIESSENAVYVRESAKIFRLASNGYKWQDRRGVWKEYDENGYLLAFGTPIGTIGKLKYENEEPDGLPTGITDRHDRQVIWVEYLDEQISTVRDLENHQVEYSYSGTHLTGVKDVLGQQTTYHYDLNGYLVKKVNAAGHIRQIEYNDAAHPISVTDEKGEGFFFEYDYNTNKKEYYTRITSSSGKIKEVWSDKQGKTKRVDINGRTIKTIKEDGRDLLITDEKGNVTRKIYDEWDNLIQVIYPDNSTESYEYEHRFNRVTRFINRRGHANTYQYDDFGKLLQKTEAVGTLAERITTFSYDAQHRLVAMTLHGDANTEETTTTWSYDSNDNLASITDPEGHTTEFLRYDILGNPLETKDKRGFIWRYSYDALSRKLSETDPLNQTSTYEYDGANNLTAMVDVAQNRWEFIYNSHNQLIKSIDPLGNESLKIYNSDQLPIQVIDEEGKSRFTEYDNEGRLVRSIDGAGNEIVYHYDDTPASNASSNLPVRIEYPTYSQRRYYDKLQRLIQTTDVIDENMSHLVHYEYDVANNFIAQTDQERKTTHFEYDALNLLVKTRDALGGVTELSYDDRDNVIAVIDANQGVTRYEYDRNNNVLKVIRPMGQVTTYEYNGANEKTVRLDANGQKVAYQYDVLNRLTQVDYYTANDHNTPIKTVRFTYDAVDNLLSYDDGITSATYTYNALQRKLSETVNYGSFTLSHAYEYYANGLKKSFTGQDGIKITYLYDDNNRLSTIDIPNVGKITYNRYQWNDPAKITLPGGSQVDLTYDPLMRLQSKVVKDPAQNILMNYGYELSPTGMITSKVTEHGEYAYEYDDLYRLTSATNPILEDESYSYDLLSNRLTATDITGGGYYDANNAVFSYGDTKFEYDANGNLIKKTFGSQLIYYEYDIDNRLIHVRDDEGYLIAEYNS